MSSFDEYRKKLKNKYGLTGTTKPEEEKTTQKGSSATSATAQATPVSTSGQSSFDSYRQKLRSKYLTDKVDSSGVTKWLNDAYSAMEEMQNYNKANADKYDANYGGEAGERIKSLLNSSKDVYDYIYNHKDEFEDFDALKEMFSQYRSNLIGFDKANYDTRRYYSQFGSEEGYNNHLSAVKYGNMSAEEVEQEKTNWGEDLPMMEYAMFALDAKEEGTVAPKEYEDALAYIIDKYGIETEGHTNAAIKSFIYEKYNERMTYSNPTLYYDSDGSAVTMDDLITVKKVDGNIAAIKSDATLNSSYEELMTYNNDIKQMENAMSAIDAELEGMAPSEENEAALAYVVDKYGIDVSDIHTTEFVKQQIYEKYLQLIDGSYSGQQKHKDILSKSGYDWDELLYYHNWNEDREDQLKAKKSYEIVANNYPVLTTAMNLFTGPIQAVEFAGDVIERGMYAGKDEHSAYKLDNIYDNNAHAFSETVSGTVSGNINQEVVEKTGSEFLGWLTSNAYGGVTSAIQSYITQAALGGVAGPVVLGLQAADSTYVEAIRNGQSTGQALFNGISAGLAEAFTERLPFEKLNKMKVTWDVSSFKASIIGSVWNAINDPTTSGLSDSTNALTYTEPKKNS